MIGRSLGCLKCGNALSNNRCDYCSLPFFEQYYLGERVGLLSDLISIYKYKCVRSCALVLASLLKDKYGAFLDDKIVSPLPTIKRHVRERGFDHMELLAKTIARGCGGRYKRILMRINSTVQVGASEDMRRKQAENAYRAVDGLDAAGKYVLIDDV